MLHPHFNAILYQSVQTPLRKCFPIKHATSIFPISIQTNEMISVIKNTDIWWIDGIEIPSGFNWSDLKKFQLIIGGSVICNIPIKPILEMLPETIKGNFWRFPFNKLFEKSIQLYALQYHQVKYKFESTTDFAIKIYQGTSFLDNEMRNDFECKTIKIRNITQPFLFQGKSLELGKQVNLISTGFLFHTQNELHEIKVSFTPLHI